MALSGRRAVYGDTRRVTRRIEPRRPIIRRRNNGSTANAVPPGVEDSSKMEKATKWDHLEEDHHTSSNKQARRSMVLDMARGRIAELEEERRVTTKSFRTELDMARGRIAELEEEKHVTSKSFLRKLEQEKSRMRLERRHRRELEAANGRLLRELKQQARSYELERRARAVMEEACSELTREVEQDQEEVELLRRECLRMREDMEEERRMLQMAEVWREERVQMKLSDAKLALEHKYSQLNRLQAEMEAFLSNSSNRRHLPRPRRPVDDKENFRRKEKQESCSKSNSNSDNDECASPATDLFLAKAGDQDDDDRLAGGDCEEWSHNSNSGRRSGSGTSKNTALIRRLWRSAITESRKSKAGGAEEEESASCYYNHNHNQKQKQKLVDG